MSKFCFDIGAIQLQNKIKKQNRDEEKTLLKKGNINVERKNVPFVPNFIFLFQYRTKEHLYQKC